MGELVFLVTGQGIAGIVDVADVAGSVCSPNLFFLRLSWSSGPLSCLTVQLHMGVSLNGGTPKWLVYNGKPY